MSNRPIFIILLSAYVLSSCGPSQSSLATSVSETELAKPTRTQVIPTATETQEPTRTPIPPTATVPVPDILSSFFINAEVQLYDPFDKNIGWGVGCDCQFSEGQFIVNGRNWNGALWDKRKVKEGEGIVMDFSFSDKSVFEVYFDIGEWNTNSYHRFGIYVADNAALANLWSGSNLISGRLIGNFSLEPDTQYSLAIMIGNDGELMAVIWDVADPTKIISTHEQVGTSWVGHTWKFAVGANLGQVVFDNLRIVSFDEIN